MREYARLSVGLLGVLRGAALLGLGLAGLRSASATVTPELAVASVAPVAPAAPAAPAARSSAPLLLGEVLDSVQRHFPAIIAAQKEQRAAEAELLAARGGFDPLLRLRAEGAVLGYYQNGRLDVSLEQPTPLWGTRFFAGWRLGTGSFADYDGKLETNEYGEVRVGAVVPLWRNGPIDRTRAAIKRAAVGQTLAAQGVAQQRLEAVRLGSQRYWEWTAAGQRLHIAHSLQRLAAERDAALAQRVRHGDLPEIERIDNQRLILSRQSLLIAAQRGLEQAQIELSIYLRDARGEPWLVPAERLPRELPLPEPRALTSERLAADIQTALARRPEAERLRLQLEQLGIDRDLAKNQLAPAVDVGLAFSQDLGAGSSTRTPPVLEGSVLFDMPIPNRTAKGRLGATEAQMARLQAQARLVRDRICAEVQDVQSLLRTAEQRVALARAELQLAQKVETAEHQRFELGDSTLVLVNLREQATADAALREIDARLDYQRAQVLYSAVLAGAPAG